MMETKKQCPYCGKEIQSVAKKCRFCGKWLITMPEKSVETENSTPTHYQRKVREDNIFGKEREYKREYSRLYEQYNGDIPYDVLMGLKEKRIALGLKVDDVDRIINKVKDSSYGIRIKNSESNSDIKIDTSGLKKEAEMLGPQYVDLIDQLDEFETFVYNVSEMSAQVSEKCQTVYKNISDIGNTITKYGFSQIKKQKSGSFAVTGVGVAISAAAEIYKSYKNYQIKKEEEAQLRILLEKKQEYANMNLEPVTKQLNNAEGRSKKITLLYQQALHKEINWENPTRYKELKMFEIAFWLQMKQIYLVQVLQFLLCEMQAWLNGEQESNAEKPSFNNILDKEIISWGKDILGDKYDQDEWRGYLEYVMTAPQKTYRASICMLFCSPYLLRNYVGVSLLNIHSNNIIQEVAYAANEKLNLPISHEDRNALKPCHAINDMLAHNAYYQECQKIALERAVYPYSFGFTDFLVLCTLFFVYLIVTFFLSGVAYGLSGEDIIGAIIIYGILCYYPVWRLSKNIAHIMPCVRKNRNYLQDLLYDENIEEQKIAEKYNNIKL